MADEDVILASVLTVVALVTARKCRRCNRSCCAIGYCAGQATVTLTKRSLLIFMKFNFVARPYTLATKSNSTVCCGRLCRKWVIFVARMSKFLSSLVASVYGTFNFVDFRQSRPCRIWLCHHCIPGFTGVFILFWAWPCFAFTSHQLLTLPHCTVCNYNSMPATHSCILLD